MSDIKHKCNELLEELNINSLSEIDFNVNEDIHTLSYEYIIDTYMKASKESQEMFLAALQEAAKSDSNGIEKFFEGMGQLLLMTHLSKNIEV